MDPVEKLKSILNFPEYFPGFDSDLLLIALTGNENALSKTTRERLMIKFNIQPKFINYQALEFYGDRVLDMLVIDEFSIFLRLNVTPGELTTAKINIVNNDNLTYFSRQLGICEDVLGIKNDKPLSKHNLCSDTFEAIIGAIYYQYGLQILSKIKSWLLSLDPIRKSFDIEIEELLREIRRSDIKNNYPSLRSKTAWFWEFRREYTQKYPYMVFEFVDYSPGLQAYILKNKNTQEQLTLQIFITGDPYDEKLVEQVLKSRAIWI